MKGGKEKMAKLRSGKFVWVTWLSRLMAGETSCEWAAWFKTRNEFERAPSTFNLVNWKITHTRMVNQLKKTLLAEGKKVLSENQARFRYKTLTLIISGQPDLIAIFGGLAGVYDCKSGIPRDSDQVQVMIYMYYLPRARPEFQEKQVKGFLQYKDGITEIPAPAIDSQFEENLQYFLGILESDEEPEKSPSPSECRFCDIPKIECPERMV